LFGVITIAVLALSVVRCALSFFSHRSGAEALKDAKVFVPVVIVSGLVILIRKWMIARRWRTMHPVAGAAVV
jgi:hypothetical protein